MNNNKINPWNELKKWFITPNYEIEDWIFQSLNNRSIIAMFSTMRDGTIFINDYFNNFNIIYLNTKELCQFLKEEICLKFNIQYRDFSYLKTIKKDELTEKMLNYFPNLKRTEIEFFLELINDKDKEILDDVLGLKKYKLSKTKKTKKKESKSTCKTFDDWKSLFKI